MAADREHLVRDYLQAGELVLDNGPVSWLDLEQTHGVDAASGFLFVTNARLIFIGDTGIAHAWAMSNILETHTHWFRGRHMQRFVLHLVGGETVEFIGGKLFLGPTEKVVIDLGGRYRFRAAGIASAE